jgi:hypothetical protein
MSTALHTVEMISQNPIVKPPKFREIDADEDENFFAFSSFKLVACLEHVDVFGKKTVFFTDNEALFESQVCDLKSTKKERH